MRDGYRRVAESGEVIATTDNLRSVFCVKEGFVKRFLIKNDGSISVQGIYGPGDCFSIAALTNILMDGKFYTGSEVYYYEAIQHTVVHEIPGDVLKSRLDAHPELFKDFFLIQSRHSQSNIWLLENQGLSGAGKRVAHIICFYMERYGVQTPRGWEFKIPLIQQDLADLLDLARETVSLAIGDLKKQKLIKGRRKVIIPSLPKLKDYAYS